eukprot:CAMPEP_0197247736 /NCGR_PEP_ID=MMETSP1429-20130617/31732_1 /TAXON_ID=49237 /ORGANISM="Chaetoceros  sp., Strain UNC1202" /LENGTH=181 /DNA_ID=CAMNT_0042708729 /DNA_START=34 /DNA_END=579 /DNA_ORIENTATION=+
MKLSLIAAALAVSSAAAFAPSSVERTSSVLNMDRRSAFGQIATAGAVLAGVPAIASADGSVSGATINRARGLYGDRIVNLKSAVDSGDFRAIAAEKSAFILFNSGAYANNKVKKNAAIAQTNEIFAGIRAGDKAAVKAAYEKYIAANAITGLPDVDPQSGQGYCNDFDFKTRSSAGAIYVR